jgi:ABC-2 type transport system ATP-binding protein
MIEVSGVSYEYPGKRALDAVSFALPARSITALVGPNGAGKTTLLRCLAGLDEPYSGAIRIAGIDLAQQPREAHRRIGFLPDHFGLYAELSARQCLHYAGRSRGLDGAALEQRLREVVGQVGLADRLQEKAGALSRGQRQRLAIAQAIIHAPQLLLLDEPASGLDPESRAGLSGLMRALSAGGMTLVVSSHILAELEEYCTGMLILQDGRMVEHRQLAQVAAVEQRRVRLRLAQAHAELGEALLALGVQRLLAAGEREAQFAFAGDDAALAGLLRGLLARGLPVCELGCEQLSLQDVYLAAVSGARSRP